ncbi:ABC transporter ATP-binding protein [Rhizobium oryzicola]|uniref:ATP-binding cassette domain-containing protein n=1 Tax=Rhizobium oryzicola TaxID=1232668 RepID=A0ABT8SW01_9HYPH|nr:ATP-binding cassette domain-containing protein [Rhizobium oryzicola]MDO1582629.1 ATP-binding cassette domain-containing protein [Rhizobium oryzicola]
MSFIQVENLSFRYDQTRTIIEDLSLSLEKGRNLGIVGESGSGKTTLLRLLLGLAQPSAGSISIDGQVLDTKNWQFMRDFRRRVQAVFQDPYSSLDPRQAIFDIVAEPLRALKIDVDVAKAVAEAATAVGLPADAAQRYPHEFSGGQRQRIAIARAIVARPDLVLADEVVSALDLSTRILIVDLLKALSTSVTFVVVSHDIALVALLCPDIAIMEKGRIVESGPTEHVLSNPVHPYTRRLLASTPRLP